VEDGDRQTRELPRRYPVAGSGRIPGARRAAEKVAPDVESHNALGRLLNISSKRPQFAWRGRRLASCHSVPLAHARAFRATCNAQIGATGNNSDQLLRRLTSGFRDCASSESRARRASQAENAGSIPVARSLTTSLVRVRICVARFEGSLARNSRRATRVQHRGARSQLQKLRTRLTCVHHRLPGPSPNGVLSYGSVLFRP
jgi:hypothetical protein